MECDEAIFQTQGQSMLLQSLTAGKGSHERRTCERMNTKSEVRCREDKKKMDFEGASERERG